MTNRLSVSLAILLAAPFTIAEEYPDAVPAATDRGIEIVGEFQAPSGLTGYVGRKNGRDVTFYLTPDREHIIIGTLLDVFGEDLSARHLAKHLPEPDLEVAWAQLAEASWVPEGPASAERMVYVFSDPNCLYCEKFHRQAQMHLPRGIQLRSILVGVISPSSLRDAARILHEQGARTENGAPSLALALRRVEHNNQLMRDLGVNATPAVFYRDEKGKVRKIVGLPDKSALDEAVFRPPAKVLAAPEPNASR